MEKENNVILWEGKPVADGDIPLRKKVVSVAKMIGGPTGIINKIDANAPEYYSLAGSISDEECDFLLAIGFHKVRMDAYLSKKLKWPLEKIHKVADRLSYVGVISNQFKEDGSQEYSLPIFAPGILEIMVVSPNAKEHPEIKRAFNQYTHDRLQAMVTMIPEGYGLMRVIPIESTLPKDQPVDERDKLSYYLDKYDKYSVGACSCRVCRTEMGEGCGHMPEDRCIKLGKAADYFIRMGFDRELTRKEVEELLAHSEEVGLMHSIPNIHGIDKGDTVAICNCCGCACFGLRPVQEFHVTEAVASNYRSEIKEENCVACGKCVENCPVNAIKLGTKLPLIHEAEIAMSKNLNAHTLKTLGNFNPDYRFCRTEVVTETGTAPCKTWCPAHIGVQGYIRMASEGKYKEALELIKLENPFPAVCGRICNHTCEAHCTRGSLDEAVAIDDIKKFIAEQELNKDTRFVPKKRYDYHDKKIAIIGSGPAGLSCAYYLAVDGYDITVFEKNEKVGGMLTLGIPGFRLQKDVVEAEIDVLRELGVTFKTGIEVGKDVTIPELRKQGFNGFYVAVGAQQSRKLGISGEDNADVLDGIDFLKNVNLGKGEKLSGNVIVVGGGNVAIDIARTAIRQGADSVNLYCLEARNEMPSSIEEIVEAIGEGVVINNGFGPAEILTEDGKLKGVNFKKCVSVFDDEHRFSPKFDENDITFASAEKVILAIGQSFDYGKLFEGTSVKRTKRNTVIADDVTYQTNEPDIFVGGDCYSGPSFAINAIAAGKEAAISLHRYAQGGQSLVAGRYKRNFKDTLLDMDNVEFKGFDKTAREIPAVGPVDLKTYKDNRGVFSNEQIVKEAGRCLKCGKAVVDPNLCIGCGQCAFQCKFDAAHMLKKTSIYAKDFNYMVPKAAGHIVKRSIKIAAGALKKD